MKKYEFYVCYIRKMPHTSSDKGAVYSVEMAHLWADMNRKHLFPAPIVINQLVRHLHKKCWTDDGGKRISPMEVKNNPRKYPNHTIRVESADLTYPILLFPSGSIFDGMHRLLRAYCENQRQIWAITIPPLVLPKFLIKKRTSELYDMDLTYNRDYEETIIRLYELRFGVKIYL